MGHQTIYSKILRSSRTHDGEVSEWFKELVLKTSDSERGRGFESHPLRHFIIFFRESLEEKYPSG